MMRGDLKWRKALSKQPTLSVGRYCVFAKNTLLKPPYRIFKGELEYFPMKIGDYTKIGENSVVEAASIGSHVTIGKNCYIGRFCVIKDCVFIEDNTVVGCHSIIPSFSRVYSTGTNDISTKVDIDLPSSTIDVVELRQKDYYEKFLVV
ncbi:Dynactin subunit 5 [Smittium culicis]|uniref:Dynactin subunit 5 n=1 Tax=Smittium culicis TaxID=133412 RepID=A0A1R1Y1T3_9FUNG|nr:Dynactin subunit 5 [Smittium culicis]OMJ07852.1 Dynactin subunit 5 [Smittium culicis]OMJ20917.1 Dynactin subunit 5 [Smittium culicis]